MNQPPRGQEYISRDDVVAALRKEIRDGKYPPGSQIPSRIALQRRFPARLRPVKQAIAILQDKGYLRSIHRVGTFVRPANEWRDHEDEARTDDAERASPAITRGDSR